MAAFDEHKEELEHYEQMMGTWRGRLAVTLDRLTDAMVLAGQHAVYCHSTKIRKSRRAMELVVGELRKAKELIQSVMGCRLSAADPICRYSNYRFKLRRLSRSLLR